ncbi:MAG: hypothetical protein QOD74_844 [Variibacter sp.]|jgi:hypothetical protein|nr:hypothetical protein [Variibacter sp.]
MLAFALASSSALAQSSSPSFVDRMKSLFSFGSPNAEGEKPQASAPQQPQQDFTCPDVDVRAGASTITVHAKGEEVATNVRYQATVAQMARECAGVGGNLAIKVGVQGRILLGPQGGPGKLDIPLRIALVHEGPEPKTLWSKLYKVPVQIGPNQTHVNFVHVEEGLTVPMPSRGADIDSYVVYVGFDALGKEREKEKPAPKKKSNQKTS